MARALCTTSAPTLQNRLITHVIRVSIIRLDECNRVIDQTDCFVCTALRIMSVALTIDLLEGFLNLANSLLRDFC
jgi:hypothetical protein